MHKKTLSSLAAAVAVTTGLGLALAGPASAHGTGNSKATGDCTMGSTWYLKADANRGGQGHTVEVTFRIRSAAGGQAWDWSISDNGTVAATGESTTASNGTFEERQSIPNLKGSDTVDLSATNTVTGETCAGEVVLKGSH